MQNIEINYIEYFLRALHIASQEIAPNMKTNTMRFTHKQLKPLRLPAGQSKLPEGQRKKERGKRPRGKSVRSPSQGAMIVCGVPKAPNHRTILK